MYESLKRYWNYRYLYQILSAVFLVYLLVIYIRVHPYELNYYNEWVGGPATVYKNRWFQISRWGSGITEGIKLLDSLPESNPSVDIRVLPFIETPLPQRQDIVIQKAPLAEYYMMNANYKWYYSSKDEIKGYSLYTSVSVMGAPLVKIYKRISNENQLPAPLNSTNWKATSNFENYMAGNVFHRDLGSLWISNHAQDPGMYFQVDMQTTARIQRIGLVTWTTPSAYPRGYEVTVSEDGESWTKVAQNPKTPPLDMVLEIPFSPVNARYIKVTQTGYSDLSGWAIHEFYAYPAS